MAALLPFQTLYPPHLNIVINTCQKAAANPLMQRITKHWRELLMLSGVVLAVISAATAFFYGSAFLTFSFFVLGSLTAISAFYMRQFHILKGLEKTAAALSLERDRLSTISHTLTQENTTLNQTNQNLLQTNAAFQQTTHQLRRAATALIHNNSELRAANASLDRNCIELSQANTHLTRHVTQLTIQISQLKESSERIRDEILLFRYGNQHFGGNLQRLDASVRNLDDQITSSHHLYDKICNQLNAHEQGIGVQVEQLKKYLHDLSSPDSITARKELESLQMKIDANKEQLHAINKEFTEGQTRLMEMQSVLTRMRKSFESVLTDMHGANQTHQTQNEQLQSNVQKITRLLKNQNL